MSAQNPTGIVEINFNTCLKSEVVNSTTPKGTVEINLDTCLKSEVINSITPKGTVDLTQKDIQIRNYIFEKAKNVLSLRGATQIETPVIELSSTVESLYGGEFNKLVYNLTDEGQKLILRYDLTVPLARFVGSNGLVKFRRFQYGKVYRRDNPQIQKGRYREFYQFDYDIVGDDQNSGTNDLEMLETLNEMLEEILGSNTYIIKINHKEVVINMLKNLQIEESVFDVIFSALDKLDKKTFEQIKEELKLKGLTDLNIYSLESMYDNLIKITDMDQLIDKLKELNILTEQLEKYLKLVSSFLKQIKVNNFKFDPFLIRGMDYYTGLLYEVTYNDKSIMESTISAGGRYDDMIGKFSTRGKIPAIGMSLGVERIAKILESTRSNIATEKSPQVYVASIGKGIIAERVALCNEIRKMGYYAIMSDLEDPSMRLQLDTAFADNIPVMIVLGPREIASGTLNIKDISKKSQKAISRSELAESINDILLVKS